MIQPLRRNISIYSAIAAMAGKEHLAYNLWVWADFITTIVSMIVFIYFWRAVYADTSTLGGLALSQTINYIVLARLLAPLLETQTIMLFGFMIRQGQIVVELTRPLDMQLRVMIETFAQLIAFIILRLPLFLLAWLFFGLQLPASPGLWAAFFISLALGQAIMFLFDWMFACLAFYVTETWGLTVVRGGAALFFSGALVPVAMMPTWLQNMVAAMPFAQALAVPVSFLSGIATLADAPRLWLIQVIWLLALLVFSRAIFNVAVRKVTVQGG